MKNITKIFVAASMVILAGCEPEFENPVSDFQATSGDANFSRYVSLGNSLTSGYTNNALYISGQQNSYPNIIAGQMAMAGGGTFVQPLMPDDIGGFSNFGIAGKLTLQIVDGKLSPVPTPAESPFTPATGGPFNNMGVPGAKSFHLLAQGYGNPAGIPTGQANPYFARMASSPNTSILADAVAQNPTFFTLWIGNNDVLSYAISGGTGVDQTGNPNPATYGSNDITDPTFYGGVMQNILETLVNQLGAKGAIANIPSVTSIPYFTTVPYNPLNPTNPAFGPMIPTLNQFYGQLNQVFDYLQLPDRKVSFSADGPSAVVIKDKDLADVSGLITAVLMGAGMDAPTATLLGNTFGQSRQATAEDLMVFTSQTVIGQVDMARVSQLMAAGLSQDQAAQLSISGITYPLEDKWVLSKIETAKVAAATQKYNLAIEQLANSYNLAFVNAHSVQQALNSASGLTYYGNTYTTTYVSGGTFSLDAVHFTPKGYAIAANYFINAINAKYGSTLREVNPNNYPGVIIP